MQLLSFVALGLIMAGIVISSYALRYYSNPAVTNRLTWWSRHTAPLWKRQDHFKTRKGFSLFVLGTCAIALGGLAGFLLFLFLSIWGR